MSIFSKLRMCTAVCVLSSSCLITGTAGAAYDQNYIGEMETYRAVYEDTLVHLAREHDLGFVEVRAANPELDPWIPGAGAEVILPKKHILPDAPRTGLVINLAEMRVYAYLNGDEAPYSYPLGIGREGLATPLGDTSIVRKKEGPTWRPTERMRKEDPELPAVVPPGPENPLGTHALYLGWPQYAIHGTQRPYGIGRRVSSGCIRMYPEDIIKFFEQVPIGTKVKVVNQPIKVAWIGDDLYLEAHPDMEQALKMEEFGAVEKQNFTDADMALIMDKAGSFAERLNWPRIRLALRERKGYPIRIARRFVDEDQSMADESTEQVQAKQSIVASEDIGAHEGVVELVQTSKPDAIVKKAQSDVALDDQDTIEHGN